MPSWLSTTAPMEPSVGDRTTAPVPEVRRLPKASLRVTVTEEVATSLAVMEVGVAEITDVLVEAGPGTKATLTELENAFPLRVPVMVEVPVEVAAVRTAE